MPVDNKIWRDAVRALTTVAAVRTSEQNWKDADDHIAAMRAAFAVDDADGVVRATTRLESWERLAGGRAKDAATEPQVPAPEPTMDRLNEMVHAIRTR